MTDDEIRQKQKALWPEVIGAVITTNDGTVNLCPINYLAASTVYEKPLTVCIGLGNNSFSLETLLKSGEFVVAYPSRDQLKDILTCGIVSGRDTNKLENTALTFSNSETIKPPILDGAVINFECRAMHSFNAGSYTIVIGEVKKYHSVSDYTLDKIYSLGGSDYGIISSTQVLEQQSKG